MPLSKTALFGWALLAAALVASPCVAGPPFITDDPEPVELGHYELYLGGTYLKYGTSKVPADFASVPFMEFNYGIAPETQIHIITPGVYDREKPGGEANYGYGDTELGLKYRFIQEQGWLPQVGVFPLLELPTGQEKEGLGNGKIQAFFPVWAQKSWDKWTVFGGGGFFYNANRDARSFWRTGVVVQRDLSEQLTLGVEFFHETPAVVGHGGYAASLGLGGDLRRIPPGPGLGGHTAFNVGGYYNFNEHTHLLFSAGRDIDGLTYS